MEEEKVKIGRFSPEHWQDFKNIRLEALSSNPEAFSDTFENTLSYPDDFWIKRLSDPNNIILYAKVNDRVVAMMSGHLKEEPEGIVSVVTGVFVNKSERGSSIGKKLMASLLEIIKNSHRKASKVKLWVNENQHPAISLYRSFGFKQVGKKEAALETPDGYVDELIMEKTL